MHSCSSSAASRTVSAGTPANSPSSSPSWSRLHSLFASGKLDHRRLPGNKSRRSQPRRSKTQASPWSSICIGKTVLEEDKAAIGAPSEHHVLRLTTHRDYLLLDEAKRRSEEVSSHREGDGGAETQVQQARGVMPEDEGAAGEDGSGGEGAR